MYKCSWIYWEIAKKIDNHIISPKKGTPTQFTPGKVYTNKRLHQQAATRTTIYTNNRLHQQLDYINNRSHQTRFTAGNVYTRHVLHQTKFTPDGLHQIPFTPDAVYTRDNFTRHWLHQTSFTPAVGCLVEQCSFCSCCVSAGPWRCCCCVVRVAGAECGVSEFKAAGAGASTISCWCLWVLEPGPCVCVLIVLQALLRNPSKTACMVPAVFQSVLKRIMDTFLATFQITQSHRTISFGPGLFAASDATGGTPCTLITSSIPSKCHGAAKEELNTQECKRLSNMYTYGNNHTESKLRIPMTGPGRMPSIPYGMAARSSFFSASNAAKLSKGTKTSRTKGEKGQKGNRVKYKHGEDKGTKGTEVIHIQWELEKRKVQNWQIQIWSGQKSQKAQK